MRNYGGERIANVRYLERRMCIVVSSQSFLIVGLNLRKAEGGELWQGTSRMVAVHYFFVTLLFAPRDKGCSEYGKRFDSNK